MSLSDSRSPKPQLSCVNLQSKEGGKNRLKIALITVTTSIGAYLLPFERKRETDRSTDTERQRDTEIERERRGEKLFNVLDYQFYTLR